MPYNYNEEQPLDNSRTLYGATGPGLASFDTATSTTDTTTSKINKLQDKKQQKIDKFNPDPTIDLYNNMDIIEGKYGITQDSLNNYTPAQLQEMLGASMNDRVYYDDPSIGPYQQRQDEGGNWNKVAYKGDTQHLYIAPSKDGNIKLGLAGVGFKERYTPGLAAKEGLTTNTDYGWAPGKQGVDPTKDPYLDVALPYNEATRLEFLVHSNKGQIANRAGGDRVSDFTRNKSEAIYGGGASEYTTQNAPMWNIDSANTIGSEGVVTPHAPKLQSSNTNAPHSMSDELFKALTQPVGEDDSFLEDAVNVGRAVGGGVLSLAELVSKAPKNLYDSLGGDYLESNSTYDTSVKAIIDTMNEGGEYLKKFNNTYVDKDKSKREALQEAWGKEWDREDEDVVGKLLGGVAIAAQNPFGTLEMAGEYFLPSKALASGTLRGLGTAAKAVVKGKGASAYKALASNIKNNTGFLITYNAMTADTANQMVDEYKKTFGHNPNESELRDIMLAAPAITAMDTIADKFVLGVKGSKVGTAVSGINTKLAETALSKVGNPTIKKLVTGTISLGLRVGEDVFVEGSTEGLQSYGQHAVSQQTTNVNDAAKKDVFLNTMGGAASGPGMHAISFVEGVATNPVLGSTKLAYDKTKAKLDARKNQNQTEQDLSGVRDEPIVATDLQEGGILADKEMQEAYAATSPAVIEALNTHAKAVSEGVPVVDNPDETSPILDKVSRDRLVYSYNKLIAHSESVIEDVHKKIAEGTHTKEDLVNRDKAVNLLITAQTLKSRYFGKGTVLNNRPLPEIQKDIAEIESRAKDGKLGKEDEYTRNVLRVEEELAKNFDTGIRGNKPIDKGNADSVKENEALHMKLYGGVTKDGKVKTGLMDYARILLNPETSDTARKLAEDALNRFIGTQQDKFYAMEKARMPENHGKKVAYGNGASTFVYHPVKEGDTKSRSEPFYQRALKEHNTMTKIADALLLGDVDNIATDTSNDNKTHTPTWHSVSYDINDPVALETAKNVIYASNNNWVDQQGNTITPEQAQEFVKHNPKLVNLAGDALSKTGQGTKAKPKKYTMQENSGEFNEYEQETTGEPVNSYARAKEGEIPTKTENQQNNQETGNGQQNETGNNEGTEGVEGARPAREKSTTETEQNEEDSGQAQEVTPVQKAKQLILEAAGLALQNKTQPHGSKASSNAGKIEAARNALDDILGHLYSTKQYKEIAEVLNSIDSAAEGFEHTQLSTALSKIIKLQQSIAGTKKEINKVEADIKSNEQVIPRMLNASWKVVKAELAAYKKLYIGMVKKYKWKPTLIGKHRTALTKETNKRLGKGTVRGGDIKVDEEQIAKIAKQKVLANKDRIQEVVKREAELVKKKEELGSELDDLQYEMEKQKDIVKPKNRVGEVIVGVPARVEKVSALLKTRLKEYKIPESTLSIIKAKLGCK